MVDNWAGVNSRAIYRYVCGKCEGQKFALLATRHPVCVNCRHVAVDVSLSLEKVKDTFSDFGPAGKFPFEDE